MTTKTNTNGQARKSLADQIDRLDAMLDGLSEGLNDAVAQAVQDAVGAAVQQAVQAVLREVLTGPELLARLGAAALPVAAPAPAASKAPKFSWKQRWIGVYRALTVRLSAARPWCKRRLDGAGRWASGVWQQVRLLACYRNQLLVAAGVGTTAGVAAYLAGPWLAAAAGALRLNSEKRQHGETGQPPTFTILLLSSV